MSYTLQIEIPMTRRKDCHLILDENKKQVFLDRKLSHCLEYLIENDIRRVEVVTASQAYLVDIEPIPWDVDPVPSD